MILKRTALLWAAVPTLGLALTLGLAFPQKARTTSSGCSRVENTRPSAGGCRYQSGSACYECEYWGSGGFKVCYENPEGTSTYCVDYQTIPF